jgi:hypothetical protein
MKTTLLTIIYLVTCSWLSLSWTSYPSVERPTLREGKDYALFFAVSDYQDNSLDMPQPLKNARDLAGELERRFDFKTEVMPNPTRAQIREKLYEYKAKYDNGQLDSDGQLLIFFTGHGVKEFSQGYFLPADVKTQDVFGTGLAYDQWRNFINEINCAHILVAVDACYSVTFDPNWQKNKTTGNSNRFGRPGELGESDRILENHNQYPSRLFFTSDAQEDVTPGRSNFARKMLDGLANHNSREPFLSAKELFATYISKAQPTPNEGDFGMDDPRSGFLFFYKATINIGETRADYTAWQQAQRDNTLLAYRQYLRDYPNGDFRYSAEQKVSEKEAEERELTAWQESKATNTPKIYEAFITSYPNSIYKREAERRLVLLEQPQVVNTNSYNGDKIFSQPTRITGKIVDKSGAPLIAASILLKGTSSGTMADIDGIFSLTVKKGTNTIVVSYTGFETQAVELKNNQSNYEIVMQSSGRRKLFRRN